MEASNAVYLVYNGNTALCVSFFGEWQHSAVCFCFMEFGNTVLCVSVLDNGNTVLCVSVLWSLCVFSGGRTSSADTDPID